MKVKVKKLDERAVMPFKKHDSDYCWDLTAIDVEEIAPNVYKYHTGLAFEIVRTSKMDEFDVHCNDQISIDGRPRSSIYKTGMVLANCEPTIDENYRGEVQMIFYHVFPNMPKYEVGDRICQIKIGISPKIEFEEVDELSDTDRGEGGFGFTGK